MGAAEVFDEFSDADSSRVGDRSTGDLESVIPIVRRIIRARVSDQAVAEDLVQETLVKVLAGRTASSPGMLEPYAIVTARNVVASLWIERDRQRRNQHRVLELARSSRPDEQLLQGCG